MTFFIIVPCYNEQEVLPATHVVLTAMLRRLKNEGKVDEGRVLYVDDGSRDATWSIIRRLSEESPMVEGLKLAHNVGHQQALWAGLEWAAAHADAAVSIDADLQDDVEVIPQMVDYYLKGIDVVFGVRRERKTDTWFKRTTALAFYALMRTMNTGVVYNHADFRLMSRRAMQALVTYPERNLFLRGMVSALGFPTAMVHYDRKERQAGESKYPLRRMLGFALDGITSFSVRPLQLITWLGMLFMVIALGAIIYSLVAYSWGRPSRVGLRSSSACGSSVEPFSLPAASLGNTWGRSTRR